MCDKERVSLQNVKTRIVRRLADPDLDLSPVERELYDLLLSIVEAFLPWPSYRPVDRV